MSALVIHPEDDVATALEELPAGQAVVLVGPGGRTAAAGPVVSLMGPSGSTGAARPARRPLTARTTVPAFHKIALRRLEAGAQVRKYGQVIGVATRVIEAGEHVHSHNLRGLRGESHGDPGL